MKVLHIVHSLTFKAGGNAKVVAELTTKLFAKGVKTSIFTTVKKGEERELLKLKDIDLYAFQQSFLARWWPYHAFGFKNALLKESDKFDIIHIHDIWHYPCYGAWYAATKIGKPYIITPHGTVEPWALKYKGLKKRIYAALIQKRILQEAAIIHALTDEEAKHIQDFGIDNTVVVIPNGINLEEFRDLPSRGELEQLYPGLQGKQVILFLGRIHLKKGLDLLAKGFGRMARKRDDVCLMIVGPVFNAYKVQVEKLFETDRVIDKVIFTGMLTGRKKLATLGGADVFVLPSYSEGFSIAILEAMICELPVIITHPCNFPEVDEVKAGIVVCPDANSVFESLTSLVDNPQLREEMGKRGRRLVLEKFTWDKIALKMINLYQEVLLKHKNRENIP